MLIFEYGKSTSIDPKTLINEAPSIWRWKNPDIAIAEWMKTLYNLGLNVDVGKTAVYSDCYANNELMTTVDNYDTMLSTVFSFYWDKGTQVAYFNFGDVNPQGLGTLRFSKAFGATDTVAKVYNGVLYPPILISKPQVTREVEPVAYTRLATQSINIEMQNDMLFRMKDDRAEKYWRFDDLVQAEELIAGQTTYLKWGDEDTPYEDLKLLHKGIVTDCTVGPMTVKLDCADKRTMSEIEWPKTTFAEEGYTEENVGEGMLDKKVPDGYGLNRLMPMTCVNRETAILEVDDEDEIVLPSNLISWDLTGWSKSSADITFRTGETIAKFPAYRIAKTAAGSNVLTPFTAVSTRTKVSGYMRCDVERAPIGNTLVAIKRYDGLYTAEIWINFTTGQVTSATNRAKFIKNDDGKVLCFYSFEFDTVIGTVYSHIVNVDHAEATTDSAVVVAGMRVGKPVYPTFKVAQKILSSGLAVHYEKDDELIEVTNIVSVDESAGTVSLYDVDAHENGMLDAGLSKLYCTAKLRPETNPMDIIADLNYQLYGIPYDASLYDTVLCEAEKQKLSAVALYKDTGTALSALVEELQAGSVVGFRYDDIDKIYIYCDDPNRPYTFNIQNGEVLNKDDIAPSANLKLYADEVTVNYATSIKDSEVLKYKNTDYKEGVLGRYSYTKPMTVDTLLTNEADAEKKSLVLLEDLSITRPIVTIKVHGLDILKDIDLYDIGYADLKLAEDRPFMGHMRVQVIGIEADTQLGFVYLTLRERVYSEVFADIVGQYADAYVIGKDEMVLGDSTVDNEKVLGGRGV